MSPSLRPCICAALLLGALASSARAEEPARVGPAVPAARQHFVQGNRLYRVRKFAEAVAQYQAAAVIEPAPIFDFNLGQCYRQLGRYADALWHYERFLRNGRPDDGLREIVTGFVRQLRAEVERARAVERDRAAFLPERPAIARSPADIATVPRPSVAARATSAQAADPLASDVARDGVDVPWHADVFGWTLLGAGVLGTSGSGVLLASASGLWNDAKTSQDEIRRAGLHDDASTRRRAAAVLGTGSAAMLVAGVIRLALHSSERSRPRAASRRLEGLGVSPHSVVLLGRF